MLVFQIICRVSTQLDKNSKMGRGIPIYSFHLGEFGGDEFRLDWALLKGVVILEWFGDVFGVFCCDQVNRPEREVVPV